MIKIIEIRRNDNLLGRYSKFIKIIRLRGGVFLDISIFDIKMLERYTKHDIATLWEIWANIISPETVLRIDDKDYRVIEEEDGIYLEGI